MSVLRATNSTIAVLLACCTQSLQAGAQTVWPAQYLPCANAAEQRVEEALLRPARLPLANVTLAELADYLSRREGIPVVMDHRAFKEVGVDPEELLLQTRSSKQSLGAVLHELLSPLELDVTISSEALLITSQDRAEWNMYARLYPVVDLLMVNADDVAAHFREFSAWLTTAERTELQQFLNSPGAIPSQEITAQFGRVEVLLEQITTHVETDSWDRNGGCWSLEYYPGTNILAAYASYHGHRLLSQYLRSLRQERAASSGAHNGRPPCVISPKEMGSAPLIVYALDEDAETELAVLTQPVTLELQAPTIDDLAWEVARQTGLSVIVDERALKRAGVPRNISLRDASYHDLSLSAALVHVLREYDLSYSLEGSDLTLTSQDEATSLMHTRMYAVGEILPSALQRTNHGWQMVEPPPEFLLRREGAFLAAPPEQLRPARVPDADSLIEIVTTFIAPGTWDVNGGEGAIEYLPPGRLLVVSQTAAVHRELENLLNQLAQYQRLVQGETP